MTFAKCRQSEFAVSTDGHDDGEREGDSFWVSKSAEIYTVAVETRFSDISNTHSRNLKEKREQAPIKIGPGGDNNENENENDESNKNKISKVQYFVSPG
jgi:hypothetical protein